MNDSLPQQDRIAVWGSYHCHQFVSEVHQLLQQHGYQPVKLPPDIENTTKFETKYDKIIVFLSPQSVNQPACEQLIQKLTEQASNNIYIPVWVGKKHELPAHYHTIAMLFLSEPTAVEFQQELLAVLSQTTNRLFNHNQYNPKAFTEMERVPCLNIEQTEDYIVIHQPFLLPLGWSIFLSAIVLLLYNTITSEHFHSEYSQIALEPGARWLIQILFWLLLWGLVVNIYRLVYPKIIAVLTPQYFLYRSQQSDRKEDPLGIKGWSSIPTAQISHFSANPWTSFRNLCPSHIKIHYFDDNYAGIKFPTLFDELFSTFLSACEKSIFLWTMLMQ